MNKPKDISEQNWLLLKKKYKNNLNKVIKKINNGYPIQYLIGNVDFFGCLIKVNKHVLIPRFETELLVDVAMNKIKQVFSNKKINIIDFGTGSGCIAIRLAKEFKGSHVTAIDSSRKALKTAKINALENECKIEFYNKKFNNFNIGKYDVLISNPPYISPKGLIDKNVKKYEPKRALYAKDNGLIYYEQILNTSLSILNNKNLILFEIGYDQKEAIEKLISNYYPKTKVSFLKDYNNLDRICIIENNV